VNLEFEHDQSSDGGLLSWVFIWSFSSTAAIIAMVSRDGFDSTDPFTSLAMGLALGTLSAAWTGLALWILLLDHVERGRGRRSRLAIRMGSASLLVFNLIGLLYFAGKDIPSLGLAVALFVVNLAGILLVRVSTKRRISLNEMAGKMQISVSQLLMVTTIVAVLLAIIKLLFVYFDMLLGFALIVMLHSGIWLLSIVFLLGRHWLAYSLCVFGLVLLLLGTTDYLQNVIRGSINHIQLQFDGMLASSFLVSTLLGLVLRSRGFRWFMSNSSGERTTLA
jgi:hypothetical protein